MTSAPRALGAAVIVATIAGCTSGLGAPSTTAVPTTTSTTTTSTTTTTTMRVCDPQPVDANVIDEAEAVEVALALSKYSFPECADDVVVTGGGAEEIASGAALAADLDAALLVVPDDPVAVRAEISRLRPRRVHMIGVTLERFPETEMIDASGDPSGDRLEARESGSVIAVRRGNRGTVEVARAYAALTGSTVVSAPGDVRKLGPVDRATLRDAERITFLGPFPPSLDWMMESVRKGDELPGGGLTLFPGRRIVALYGTPFAASLGVLGETPVAESIAAATDLAARYEAVDGVRTVPGFDLITTVASAGPGEDGDYSEELDIVDLRPWVDAAGKAGVYVVLDLQPGRTDFLTQARAYEELLLLPHVGLALDPEWRLEPDQVHLRQIGSVAAAEINEVGDWLAALVRDNALPQKLFVIHQFKLSMIADRETIRGRPELATVIQMDGQGPLGSKYGTYDALLAGTDGAPWRWGWKNFYDEDTPTATPEQTLAVEPQPVFISYQ